MAKKNNKDEAWEHYLEMNKRQAERIRDVYGLVPAEELEKTQKELDPEILRNMERCADFVARMLIKYGRKVVQRREVQEYDEVSHKVCDV